MMKKPKKYEIRNTKYENIVSYGLYLPLLFDAPLLSSSSVLTAAELALLSNSTGCGECPVLWCKCTNLQGHHKARASCRKVPVRWSLIDWKNARAILYEYVNIFIAPRDNDIKDWIGAFAVTAGTNVDIISNEKSKQNNDYESIMIKVIGDRIAEALAEKMHEDVRKKLWGYSSEENLNNSDLIKEKYIGIRPAPGYPACPDHSEKEKIWKLLDIENNSKMQLTESYAVSPASSVTGWYFSHPKSKYFSISQISNDQLKNYANRKGVNEDILKKILSWSGYYQTIYQIT